MDADRRTVEVRVRGRVQGVYYRGWTVRQARSLSLDGWVANRVDGSVEAVLSGAPAAVQTMVARLWHGPPDAEVTGVEVAERSLLPPPGFTQRPTV